MVRMIGCALITPRGMEMQTESDPDDKQFAAMPMTVELAAACGLQIRDTADGKPAPPGQCATHPVIWRGEHLTFLQFLINTGLQPGGEGRANQSRFNGLADPRSDSPTKPVKTVGFHAARRHPTEVGC